MNFCIFVSFFFGVLRLEEEPIDTHAHHQDDDTHPKENAYETCLEGIMVLLVRGLCVTELLFSFNKDSLVSLYLSKCIVYLHLIGIYDLLSGWWN